MNETSRERTLNFCFFWYLILVAFLYLYIFIHIYEGVNDEQNVTENTVSVFFLTFSMKMICREFAIVVLHHSEIE